MDSAVRSESFWKVVREREFVLRGRREVGERKRGERKGRRKEGAEEKRNREGEGK